MTQNQQKIVNATIGHVQMLEQVIQENKNILTNITRKLQRQVARTLEREEIKKHMILLNTIITDLQEDITEYLTPEKNKAAMTRLLPINQVVAELKEAPNGRPTSPIQDLDRKLANSQKIRKY